MDPHQAYLAVMEELKKHVAGNEDILELMFICMVADGHALLEGVPGLAKTTMSKALADTIQADFKRVQGLPDLEPRDIVGYNYVDRDNSIKFKKGPIFSNILLIDELNRAPPRTMAAFLETLEERQVTLEGVSMPLQKPFTALATQNPLKIEGTEPLPKVLADRFIMRIAVDYPTLEEEEEMVRIKQAEASTIAKKVIDLNDIIAMQQAAKQITMPEDVLEYMTKIVAATRKEIHVVMGASPRADIAFLKTSKAKALIEGRKEVNKDDIKFLAKPVLSHRIVVRSTGGIGVNGVIDGIIAAPE
ncbi:MAG: MoxR family ATPase [Candidatus Micrarchaeota archaeon]|nr:MoxR family ATPase [Candidatus Micrarchaeota archaeon]